ncbi:MAG: glycoside hydrolase family 18 protein [Algoriphagus sp.]|jgi:chitinase|uniref:glycoside hydrolase family 18 protein n=1 Tax=Algoriphagus sp. TaxID=1872435 RepID=UPI0026231965|nr:glycoside hydrolase family 18 protein [Algoriphagus sp.]MDG1275654.1 glycoside hydrolase family 18 protein [Algoriphagus sp.]
MKNYLLIFLFLFLFQENFAQSNPNKVVIGYIAGWKDVEPEKIPVEKLTHINYAFANVVDGIIRSGDGLEERDSLNFLKLHSLKSRNPNLKVLVSIGGWSWSKGFSDAALTPESRKIITASGIDFLIKHRLDGLDFDWEYPALQGDNNVVRDVDKENFVAMLKSFREALDSLGAIDNKHYLSTIATGGFRKYLEVNDLRTAQQYLDLINIMSYDLFGAGDDTTGHHANLYKGNPALMPAAKRNRSVESAVMDHIEFGIPREKIVVGIPFYGKRWKDVGPENNGLYQPGTFDRGLSQDKIYELQSNPSYREWWDYNSENPFLYSEENREWVTFESRRSIEHKIYFMKKEQLAGVMFWELSEDPSGSLLDAIDINIKRPLNDFKLKR